ncbi:TM2 domain-containing protein [Breznakiellaceae bacterium SP9]
MKSKLTAYLLWFFFGLWGAHKFYLGKIGLGIAYIFTGAFLGIGWLVDLFTLGSQVDLVNLQNGNRSGGNQNQNQNVVVNVNIPQAGINPQAVYPQATVPAYNAPPQVTALSPEKQILNLSKNTPLLSLRSIITDTSLESDEAQTVLQKLVDKGIAREVVEADGKLKYDFS